MEQGGRCSSVCCCLPGLPRRLRLRQVPPQTVVPRRQRLTLRRHRSICARQSPWMEESCFTYAASRPIRPRDGRGRPVRRYGTLLPIRPSLPIRVVYLAYADKYFGPFQNRL